MEAAPGNGTQDANKLGLLKRYKLLGVPGEIPWRYLPAISWNPVLQCQVSKKQRRRLVMAFKEATKVGWVGPVGGQYDDMMLVYVLMRMKKLRNYTKNLHG